MQNKIDNIFKIATVLSFFLIGLGNFKTGSFDFIYIYFIITLSIFICFLYITYRIYKPLPNIILKLIIKDKMYINILNISLHKITITYITIKNIKGIMTAMIRVNPPDIIHSGNDHTLFFSMDKKDQAETITLDIKWNDDLELVFPIVYKLSFWEKRKISKILNKNKI